MIKFQDQYIIKTFKAIVYNYVMSVLVDIRVKKVMNNTVPLLKKKITYPFYLLENLTLLNLHEVLTYRSIIH